MGDRGTQWRGGTFGDEPLDPPISYEETRNCETVNHPALQRELSQTAKEQGCVSFRPAKARLSSWQSGHQVVGASEENQSAAHRTQHHFQLLAVCAVIRSRA